MPTTRLGGASSGNIITQVFTSSATLSGVWTDSTIIEDYEGRSKLVWVQNVGTGSGKISALAAFQSGGPYIALISGVNVATSGATYSGVRIDSLTEPYPFFKLQHRDGVDGSGTNVDAWVAYVK